MQKKTENSETTDKKKELGKALNFFALWWLIVMTCALLGELNQTKQPKYEVWEEEQLIFCFWDENFYAYDIVCSEYGKITVEIENGKGDSCIGYPDSDILVVTGDSIAYREIFREIFEVLCDYYSEKW